MNGSYPHIPTVWTTPTFTPLFSSHLQINEIHCSDEPPVTPKPTEIGRGCLGQTRKFHKS